MGTLTSREHWDSRQSGARARPPSTLNVTAGDAIRLLRRHVKPHDKVLEIGCAPGKFLLGCAMNANAVVSGVEYAPESFRNTVRLFDEAGQSADIRNEDIFSTTFGPEFDVVYSFGLIEHFFGNELLELVTRHVDLLKPGGIAIITIPDFKRVYGAILARTNKAIYDTHNIELMTIEALAAVAPPSTVVNVFRFGRLSPWFLSHDTPKSVLLRTLFYAVNVAGLLQPMQISTLCPMIAMTLKKT